MLNSLCTQHCYRVSVHGIVTESLSHQSCATGTLLLRKKIYPRKYSLNLRQLIFFFMLLIMCSVLGTFDMLSCSWQERQCALQVCLGYGGVSDREPYSHVGSNEQACVWVC